MGNPVDHPEEYDNQLMRMMQHDGSFKAGLRIYDATTTKTGKKKRDVSWSFVKRDEAGEIIRGERGAEYWYVNWTMWEEEELIEGVGTELARLFAPGMGERNVWISILLEPESVWAEGGDNGKVYLKIDPNDDPEKKGSPANRVWLHRPNWTNMSSEQQMLWEAKGKPDWINMFTCQGGDPFADPVVSTETEKEEAQQEQEPVAVGVTGEQEEYLDW